MTFKKKKEKCPPTCNETEQLQTDRQTGRQVVYQCLQSAAQLLRLPSAPLHSPSPLHLLQAASSLRLLLPVTVAALKRTVKDSLQRLQTD